ncbi:DNAJ HEAT SHOCK N-TERMINAL DOMAIN-CONTAINING PROTEIN [Salix purpurea]|uniref:DNAJ HEAT SHOCK N-TERMINAL DOMAIN-CONTAINING PROTEIN n=1 Tax=Salix purpurea TaxID=77065 RepID=A0A9Q0ZS91_SALPP|nr:DNAJ HEAT SHOCK N-TERMINAL DOMAIN-CONTAINING PROTEIN [Salix purpurea]
MGRRTKKKHREDTPTSPSSYDDDVDTDSSIERRRSRHRHRGRSDGSSRRDKERKRDKEEKRRRRKDRDGERKRRKSKKRRDYESESSGSGSALEDREIDRVRLNPGDVVKEMLSEFPNVGGDLKQLLQMIDDGQAVDIKGISERSLIKHLKKLFISLNLKENGDRVFLLPPKAGPTLEVVGPLIQACAEPKEQQVDHSIPSRDVDSMPPDAEHKQETDDNNVAVPSSRDDASAPRRRVIGPEMPSAELLAAAAKLTEAQAELREAELEEDTELFIGPAPPAVVAEAASANEAERFEEVTRIMDTVGDSPYDVVGVNRNMSADNLKKRYWKLSLLVHPDKCSHPQAHQAFVKLNKAFKDLQDPEKRKLLDDEIKRKEEQEELKVELRAMREAAQWRRMQGISMEGDDELLAETEVKVAPTRDEWMTTLPPEKKPGGMPTQSRSFSKNTKEGRGDTSVWTDNPLDRAQKAKMNYLEAYNEAAALASNEEEKQRGSADADLVDKYNKVKRSKSLVQKHQEDSSSRSKKKSKQKQEKEEWVGQHPWKPWDREKDLEAGRKSIKLESDNMAQGLSSRFSSGNFQRNFL